MKKRDLITVADLSDQEIEEIFDLADTMVALERTGPEARAISQQ